MVILGLGTAWILDGLEIQLVASAGYAKTLGMSSAQVGLTSTIYLLGQVSGALIFGRLTDKLGRKRLFIITLAIYLIGSGVAGLSPTVWFLYVFRFIAGMGIGGEYSAINSAIDELIPGKYRGRVDLAINGTYWAGAMLGALGSYWLLDTNRFAENVGWRIAFFIGPVLGLIIIFLRRHIPESPRWLVTHGRGDEAEKIVAGIERDVQAQGKQLPKIDDSEAWWIKAHEGLGPKQLAYVFFKLYPIAHLPGPHADDHPVVPLQRHLLHLLAGAAELLRQDPVQRRAVLLPVRDRQPARSAGARTVLRHRRAGGR